MAKFIRPKLSYFLINLGFGAALTVLLQLSVGRWDEYWRFYDSLFAAGGILLLGGLFKIVRHLGFFDLTVYSYKRLFQFFRYRSTEAGELGAYTDYLTESPYQKPFVETLCAGILIILLSIVIGKL